MEISGNNIVATKYQFLSGGGEMGKRMREKDWSQTLAGSPATWPQSLRTTLGIILNSKFPMFLWWGPDLICFYNDAYRPSLGENGKHPFILGQRAEEAWPEIWTIIKPLIDQVLAGGEATWSEDQLIPIFRNGKLEDVYWTFSYSPVNDESGKVSGVLVTCSETTEKVKILNAIKESEDQLSFTIDAAQLATWDLNPVTNKFVGNDRLKHWFGLPPDAEIELPMALERIIDTDRKKVIDAIQKALTPGTGGKYEIAYTIINLVDKKERIVLAKGKAVFNNDKAIRFSGTLEDITDERNRQYEILEREQKFRLLADSMPQFVWTSDAEGNLNYFNQSVYNYSGLTAEQIQKEGWLQIVHPDERDKNAELWMHSVATGKDFLFEHRFKRNDGEYRWQLSRAIPQRDAQGNIQMWVGSSTDIQEIKEVDQQKDYFISMASHELKTPITSIKGYVQMLQTLYTNGEDAFLKNSLRIIDKQIVTLTNLITDLLDLSKIKSGSLGLTKENFPLNELIKEIVEEIKHVSPDYNFIFSAEKETEVHADRERIGQVMRNFLTNAVKYSPASQKIKVTSTAKDDHVIVSVEDAGIGINKTDQEKIFERFYRVEGKSEKTFPGFGIGLFICAEIIERHNGKIGVTSEPGKGSVFYFSIPLR